MVTSWFVTSFVLLVLLSATQQLFTVSESKDVGAAQNNPLYFKLDQKYGINCDLVTSYIHVTTQPQGND